MDKTEVARRLRRNSTKEEKQLWRDLRAGRFAGFKFRRQYAIGDYYLDFFWNELRHRTGCLKVMRKAENHRFVAPNPNQLTGGQSTPAEE